ncbi:hypothetical protein C0J52_05181 [Blattella germanica]|nr:hypothetical protein C0J52_05181 [Blattella germanica]
MAEEPELGAEDAAGEDAGGTLGVRAKPSCPMVTSMTGGTPGVNVTDKGPTCSETGHATLENGTKDSSPGKESSITQMAPDMKVIIVHSILIHFLLNDDVK